MRRPRAGPRVIVRISFFKSIWQLITCQIDLIMGRAAVRPGTIRTERARACPVGTTARRSAMAGVRAYRVAYSALKQMFEKKADRWVKKDHNGPPGAQSEGQGIPWRVLRRR
jgi:hypothetical protein